MIRFYEVYKLHIWVLFSIFITPYIIFYNHNFEQLIFFDTLQALSLLTSLFLFVLCATYLLGKFFPNLVNFFFILFIVSVGLSLNFEFFYTNLIVEKISPMIWILNPKLVLVLAYLLSIFLAVAFFRFEIVKIFLLFFALSGWLLPAVQIATKALNNNPTELRFEESDLKIDTNKNIFSSKENVYFIMLDGYASEETFKRISYDNGILYDYLDEEGFIRLGENGSYNVTYLGLASIFNLTYPVVEGDPRFTNRLGFYPNMLSNEIAPTLIQQIKHLGYDFIFSGNTWSGCDPKHVTCLKYTTYGFLNHESSVLLSKTILGRYLYLIVDRDHDAMSILIKNFNSIAKGKNSQFYFLHHFSPHPPYLSEDCQTLKSMSLIAWEPLEDYIKTVECVNEQAMKLISVISNNDPSGIIVVQSDHGPVTKMNWMDFSYQHEDMSMKNRIGIINSIKAPEECHQWLKSSIGPINTIRFVLSCLKRKEPEYVEEKTYITVYKGEDFGIVTEYASN